MRKLRTAAPGAAPESTERQRTVSGLQRSSPEFDEPLDETAYLLRSPKNAKRLLESIAELESGKGESGSLLKNTAD